VDSLGANNYNQTHYTLSSGKVTKDPNQSFDMIPDPTAVEKGGVSTTGHSGLQCTPNPFSRRITIKTGGTAEGILSIFAISGKRLFSLPLPPAGFPNGIVWDAKDKPSGLYYVEFKTRGRVYGKKLSLVR